MRWDKKPRRAWCPGSQENNKEEEGVIKNITKCCREIKTRVKRNPLCSVLCVRKRYPVSDRRFAVSA